MLDKNSNSCRMESRSLPIVNPTWNLKQHTLPPVHSNGSSREFSLSSISSESCSLPEDLFEGEGDDDSGLLFDRVSIRLSTSPSALSALVKATGMTQMDMMEEEPETNDEDIDAEGIFIPLPDCSSWEANNRREACVIPGRFLVSYPRWKTDRQKLYRKTLS